MGMMKSLNVSKILGGGKAGPGKTLAVTKWFFDSPKVASMMDAASVKVLSKFGAYVRRTMRSSIRRAKGSSKPGNPPKSHGADLLKKFIFFAFDPQTRSVVIGPERLNAKVGDTPRVLEFGGRNEIATYRKRKIVARRIVNIKARPYANPALKKDEPKLPAMWRDAARVKV